MRAFITNLGNLLQLDTTYPEPQNFKGDKKQLVIPMYQREYKWTNDRIDTLIEDIKKRDKFLGNIILDERKNCYEIVDGQQRLTTCLLILVAMYNHFAGHKMEQETISKYIKNERDELVLKNESIGTYLKDQDNTLELFINDDDDIYNQKDDFKRAYEQIAARLKEIGLLPDIIDFKTKLLSCDFLILISDTTGDMRRPVEQLFLDINEKAQLLLVEDIFKGHCFEKFPPEKHDELKKKWIEIKKNSARFLSFGFESTSQYIYLFFLLFVDKNLPNSLNVRGKHILDDKTIDEINDYLNKLIDFGNFNYNFFENLNKNDYRFTDICINSKEYDKTSDHEILKTMCLNMLSKNNKAIYQELPLLCLIYYFSIKPELSAQIKHKELRSVITNLYVYTNLFLILKGKKSKSDIDHSVRDSLKSDQPIKLLMTAAKQLRINYVKDFALKEASTFERLSFYYSIIDYYSSNENWVKKIYIQGQNEDDYTREHLLIAEKGDIKWIRGDKLLVIKLDKKIVKEYKNNFYNFILLTKKLNGDLLNFDIVTKICMIKDYFSKTKIPNHIDIIFKYIEGLNEYKNLLNIKNEDATIEEVTDAYNKFLSSYFENKEVLYDEITKAFQGAFSNSV